VIVKTANATANAAKTVNVPAKKVRVTVKTANAAKINHAAKRVKYYIYRSVDGTAAYVAIMG
jgi:hypothetical protein